ncbi:MAG: hypothetical protein ABC360_00205 [Acetomicrobium sp.]
MAKTTVALVYYRDTPKHEPKSRYGFKLWDIRGDREAEVTLEPRARCQDRPLLPHRRRTVCLSPELEDHEAVAERGLCPDSIIAKEWVAVANVFVGVDVSKAELV